MSIIACRRAAAPALAALALLGCAMGDRGAADRGYTMADFASVPKFDAHVHANSADPALIDQAKADGFALLTINVDYPDFPPLAEQARLARRFAAAAPGRIHFATTFPMQGWGDPQWPERTSAAIAGAVSEGAVAVKVWKNVGMEFRDRSGRLVMVDDEGFRPVWQAIERLGIPLIGHQGEPRNCWLPLDRMTTANDRAYFAAHPQYHMYLHPELPGYEAQMAARDRLLRRNPGLRFVGAHMASLEWSVDRLAAFLDANPQATIDLAARMAQVQHQSVRDHAKVREFFIRYQDRILYGTDLTHGPGDDPAAFRENAHRVWLSDWRYLATGEAQRIDNIDASPRGLALPRGVIDKIYRLNARRVFLGERSQRGGRG
ncbi:amidohydrolase [Sphingomonas parva]|uniref:Amidohydrolase n=2 Tax=Sphingomonas parva TaxID=2555898 RepID=A0A4Y8ZLS9_9SPHN|nr:amidohydrolase [Sphingomonas parva]